MFCSVFYRCPVLSFILQCCFWFCYFHVLFSCALYFCFSLPYCPPLFSCNLLLALFSLVIFCSLFSCLLRSTSWLINAAVVFCSFLGRCCCQIWSSFLMCSGCFSSSVSYSLLSCAVPLLSHLYFYFCFSVPFCCLMSFIILFCFCARLISFFTRFLF